MFSLIFGAATAIFKVVAGPIMSYFENRAKVRSAELDVELARLEAKKELAVYQIKADLEWDLQWAKSAENSWKDEYLLILWSLPFVCVFIPWTRPFVMDGFDYLKTLNPDVANWYFWSWTVIFAAVFGVRKIVDTWTKNTSLGKAIEVISTASDDIPEEAATKAAEKVAATVSKKAKERWRKSDDNN